MAGVKLYHQYRIDDPVFDPIFKLCEELDCPVLMHAVKGPQPPTLSNAEHFLTACRRFPGVRFLQGHIGGGGDWQWNLRMLEGLETDNYFIDIGGTVIDAGIIRATVDAVGADRVLFATDGVMDEGVGKLLAARLSYQEMKKICSGNWERIAQRRKC
jgi:predicted TIM-barrel fold metal-dependent hydrolase